MTPTHRLLDFAAAPHRLPPGVRADTLRLLSDTLSVGAAGLSAPGAAGVLAAAVGWGSGTAARTIGNDARLPAAAAAFVNGFRIHCLEWDAVHEPAVVHALSVVTAALGAAIDRMGGCEPEDALTALAVGVEIASGLGDAATSPLRFFRPATAGCIGAALALARIERAERGEFADVLGLAYSFCAGTMQAHVEASIALPLQIANAARAAIMAVDLAREGLTGPHDAIEGPFGYFALFDEGNVDRLVGNLGTRWRIAEVSTKPYPSGRASHGVLGALANLTDVGTVVAHVPPLIARLVDRPFRTDMTPAYARLCLPLLAALMMRDSRIDPRQFVPETFRDAEIAGLAGRLTIVVDDNPDLNALSPQRLMVDGDREIIIRAALGSPAAPMSSTQTAAKLALASDLAGSADPRLFSDPLGYFTEPA